MNTLTKWSATLQALWILARAKRGYQYQNPYPIYHQLRQLGPVLWLPLAKVWLVTGYDEVNTVLRSSAVGWGPPPYRKTSQKQQRYFRQMQAKWVGFLDEPDHQRVRGPMQHTIQAKPFEPVIQKQLERLLPPLVAQKQFDLIQDFAFPFATAVILDMFDIPEADRPTLLKAMVAQVETFSPSRTDAIRAEGDRSMKALMAYMLDLVNDRRAADGDDWLSGLLAANQSTNGLSDDELIANAIMMLVSGFDNVISALGNTLWALFSHPDQLALVRADLTRLPDAIEEALRFDSPLQLMYRRVLADGLDLKGIHLKKGDGIVLALGAAHRDPAQYPQPDQFDITRRQKSLAFGLGIHYCLGAQLAQCELRMALTELLKIPDLVLVNDQPDYDQTIMFHRPWSLWVKC